MASTPKIKPLPSNLPPFFRYVKLCKGGTYCKGHRCWFAHSQQEKEAWDEQLRLRENIPESTPRRLLTLADYWPTKKIKPEVPSKAPIVIEVHSNSFYKYRDQLDCAQLTQPLSRNNYVAKFHHLLCWEEQEHDKVLKQRCSGTYEVTVLDSMFIPDGLEYDYDIIEKFTRFGYISDSDGDKLSYAKQASEGSFIYLDEHNYIKAKHVFARIPKEANANAIVFAVTNEEATKLSSLPRRCWSHRLFVHFELKHSYFQRMHDALDKVTPEIIEKIMPSIENFIDDKTWVWNPGKPDHESLKLDSYQQRALRTILNCSSGAPALVTGPFGTGKTRLLARAAYEILRKFSKSRVLICAHHQASVDTFVEILGPIMDHNEMIRVIPNDSYHSKTRSSDRFSHLFIPRHADKFNKETAKRSRLVITTLGTLTIRENFTHILIDEGAQTREPEILRPICFANPWTRIVIAGDHLQVGPRLLVLGEKAQMHGLSTSLLERLHNHYIELGEAAEKHIASLLTNYRSQSGILMLPSSLFYGSTLQCRTRDQPHPLADFPLQFICTSLNNTESNSQSEDQLEALTLLNQVRKFVDKWPEKKWGEKDLAKVCIMSPSADQCNLIRKFIYKNYKDLIGVEVLKAYEIQGREFKAIFIGTSEITYMKDAPHGHEEGEPQNLTKSVSDRFVFNTAITRSQYLVVAVGNPFLLLHIEKCMKRIYGHKAVSCWSHFMRQCLECKTFHFTNEVKKNIDKQEFAKLRKSLYNALLHVEEKEHFDIGSDETEDDSILNAYQHELEKIPECKNAKLTLSQVAECDLAWIMSDTTTKQCALPPQAYPDEEDEEDYEDAYECVLECQTYRKANATPLDQTKHIVTIRGTWNRIPAFNGDTVRVGVFRNNPENKCYGKVLEVIGRGHEPRFLCRVCHRNPFVFYPIDELNPGFWNLPRISRDLLKRRDKDAIEVELESRKDVVVFSSDSIGVNIKEGKVPPIKQIIPLSVAKNMLFTVAFIQWKKTYRTPLGIVVGVVPKGHSAFSAERMLKMKHAIEYDDDGVNEEHGDAPQAPDSGPLYDRVFTIDPDNAQNLDDAISFVKLSNPKSDGTTEHYQLGVHIVNCAKYITQDEDIDRRAKQRGASVYGGQEGKVMQMLPAKTRDMLSLTPNKIRDVISVVAIVTFDSDKVSVENVKIEQSQIKSCIQLTYKSAQDIMNGENVSNIKSKVELYDKPSDQPTLSDTLQLLFKMALDMRRKRLGSDAAYSYDLNEPEDSYCWQSHMLIEEMMVWANNFVAERIHTCYPDTALLRRQPEPNKDALSDFVDQYKSVARFSLSYSHLGCAEDAEDASFIMTATTLSRIKEAISSRNAVHLASLFFSESNHPQIAAVKSKHRSILPRAEYCCTSNDMDDSFYHHYSLKLNNYTHFSSPLRRYLDVEVQRMLAQLPEVSGIETTPKAFCQDDHQKLCKQLNMRVQNAKQFKRSVNQVQLAMKFSSSTEVYEAFITDNVKGTIELWFPHLELNTFPQKERKIPLKNLGPYANVKNEDLESTITDKAKTFHWKIQMTSFSADEGKFVFKFPKLLVKEDSKEFDTADNITVIDVVANDEHDSTMSKVTYKAGRDTPVTVKLSLDQWRKALNFVKDPSKDNIKELESAFSSLSAATQAQNTGTSVSIKSSAPLVYVDCQMDFKPHDVVQVWLTRSMRKALMAPMIQMIEVSPLWRICVQHNTHPAECFSDQNLSQASRKFYSDINEYVDLWEKVLLAEAAEKSVKDSKQVVIHDVNLEWPSLCIPSNCVDEEYYQPNGSIVLNLPTKYVENCSEFIKFNEGDLVCARYGTDPNAIVRAVFHMVVHKVHYVNDDDQNEDSEQSKVWMKIIGDSNGRISEKMKAVLENKSRCELQLISLSTSYKRVYLGLLNLLDGTNEKRKQLSATTKKQLSGKREISNVVSQIALGNEVEFQVSSKCKEASLKVFDKDLQAKKVWTTSSGVLLYLNHVQEEAADLAFTKPFQLIQGPPGTGKSETGAHIAYTFAMANRQMESPQMCVLYCGPSNKSVDVVLEKLHILCKSNPKLKLKLLRIYNRAVETRECPGADNRAEVKSDYAIPDWAQAYTLHNRIRAEGYFATKLKEFESKLKELPLGSIPNGRMCKDYRKLRAQAEDAVLQEHFDIVLCTCNETSSRRIARCVFPRQCIVDECGMANEPECITPLQLCDHIVLIGDHKQLQPVIDYQPAKENGLSTSLFQRYADKLCDQDNGMMKTLTIQYRMHEAICEFPSKHFYNGMLETDDSIKKRSNPETKLDRFWPGPEKSRCPILFCDVIGKEGEHKTGSKATGGKKIGIDSKFNENEANKVAEIVQTLCKDHKVDINQIAVLTPYSAQKVVIAKKMKEVKLDIKVASITESQGDEYGIVVLSTVRSLPLLEIINPEHVQPDRGWLLENLGFLTDEHQLNVGITRSKYGLIIVGNKTLLKYDKNWKALIDYYDQKGCIVEGANF